MIKHLFDQKSVFLITFSLLITFVGCEKKTEKADQTKEESTEQTTQDNSTQTNEPAMPEPVSIPDIKGKWTGTFDKRETTLTITEQTDSSFSGKITINYRQVINQEVKGTFSPSTLKMTMTDQLHSRYAGAYSGKLSKELNNFSGTFTMKVDGSNFSFNLNKK